MPTPNRQNYIINKTREEYRANRAISDPEEIEFLIRLADTNLDTVLVQVCLVYARSDAVERMLKDAVRFRCMGCHKMVKERAHNEFSQR